MEKINKMNEYTYYDGPIEISQYDEYDFSRSKIVDARYVHAMCDIDRGNPYIEALPWLLESDAVIPLYTRRLVSFNYNQSQNESTLKKMLEVGTLRNIRFPLPFQRNLEYEFYNTLLVSYRARRQISADRKPIQYTCENTEMHASKILYGNTEDSTDAGFSLIGYSGCGKSSAISCLVAHYPQVIMHEDGAGGYFPQVVYLVVTCSPNSNFSALYESIGEALDRALENTEPVYAKQIRRATRLGEKTNIVASLINTFSIGVIIFDEIQLVDFEHIKESSFDSLLTLANKTKVGLAVVGTEEARAKMFHELRTTRRIGKMINGNYYCADKRFFRLMVIELFKYQWFDTIVSPTDEIIDTLFDLSKGIVDQLVGIYQCVNYDYLSKKKRPTITAGYIRTVAHKYYPGMQAVLATMDVGSNDEEIARIKETSELQINQLLDEARQKQEIENLEQNQKTKQQKSILLSNVAANVKLLYDEFSDQQIEQAFNSITSRKENSDKSEREVSRLVVDSLLKKHKKSPGKKNNLPKPSLEQMQAFLGIPSNKDE